MAKLFFLIFVFTLQISVFAENGIVQKQFANNQNVDMPKQSIGSNYHSTFTQYEKKIIQNGLIAPKRGKPIKGHGN